MTKKNQANVAKVESVEGIVMLEKIQAGLPKGYTVTNKKAIQKKIQAIDSSISETFWTSWVQNHVVKGLGYLKENGQVKFIPEGEYHNYLINGRSLN